VLVPAAGADAQVAFSSITSRGGMVKYQLFDAQGALADQGVMSAEVPVKLPAGTPHYQLITADGNYSFSLTVKSATWAAYSRVGEQGLHFLSKTTPLHFEVPAGVTKFALWLSSDAPGETAAATLYAPDGQKVASFNTTQRPVDRQDVAVAPQQAGWWTLTFEKPETGVVDDVYIKLGNEVPGFVALDPTAALAVQKK
jgi:hypothetical protein